AVLGQGLDAEPDLDLGRRAAVRRRRRRRVPGRGLGLHTRVLHCGVEGPARGSDRRGGHRCPGAQGLAAARAQPQQPHRTVPGRRRPVDAVDDVHLLRGAGGHRPALLGRPPIGGPGLLVGNPLLNPAVLIFLALVLPWHYVAVRIVFAVLIAVGASALLGRWVPGRADRVPAPRAEPARLSHLPVRYVRSLSRFTLILVPEHFLLVLVIGFLSPWLTGVYGLEAQLGVAVVLVVAIVGTLLVIPTGGEIPIILTLLPLGVGAGVTGALLVALPALSIPSMVMVGRDMGWRTTAAMGAAVAVAAVLAGAALT